MENAVSESTLSTLHFSLCVIDVRADVEVWIKETGVIPSAYLYSALHSTLVYIITTLFLYQKTKKPKTFSFNAVLLYFVMKQCYSVCNQMVDITHESQITS